VQDKERGRPLFKSVINWICAICVLDVIRRRRFWGIKQVEIGAPGATQRCVIAFNPARLWLSRLSRHVIPYGLSPFSTDMAGHRQNGEH